MPNMRSPTDDRRDHSSIDDYDRRARYDREDKYSRHGYERNTREPRGDYENYRGSSRDDRSVKGSKRPRVDSEPSSPSQSGSRLDSSSTPKPTSRRSSSRPSAKRRPTANDWFDSHAPMPKGSSRFQNPCWISPDIHKRDVSTLQDHDKAEPKQQQPIRADKNIDPIDHQNARLSIKGEAQKQSLLDRTSNHLNSHDESTGMFFLR